MSIITITLTGFGPYFISGIPRQVELETNIPATIFYTLDGSTPDYSSSIYLNAITLPTDVHVYFKAWATNGVDSGILEVLFSTESKLYYPWRSNEAGSLGIAVDAYGVEPVLTDGYGSDADGNITEPVRSSDYPLYELDIKYSRTGPDGYGPGTIISMGIPPESYWQDNAIDPEPSSPNNENVFFNPRSLYIVIDGRDGYSDESVYPINRPIGGTTDDVKFLQGRNYYVPTPYISGGLIRPFYNYNTGIVVFYYFDSNECRWIKSIQNFDTSKVPKRLGQRTMSGPPVVIPWIYNKRSVL
jgi:hypothetical protein